MIALLTTGPCAINTLEGLRALDGSALDVKGVKSIFFSHSLAFVFGYMP